MAFQYPTNEPPSFGRHIDLTPIAEKVLRLSHVDAGHKLVVYADNERTKAQVDAFLIAGEILGAETMLVMTTPRNNPRDPYPIAVEALSVAQTIVDLSSASWIYTTPFSVLLDKGIRILSSMTNPDTWAKLPPDERLSALSRKSGGIIDSTDTVRTWSDSGTDLELSVAGRPGTWQDGLLDEPGDWDNFPSHQAAAAPLETSATGTLVLNEGDLLVQLRHVVSTPIRITVSGGRIVEIEGKSDAALLRRWFQRWNDPNAYVASHIGWGLEPRAEIASMQMMEWESYGGGVMIAFGSNDGRFLGGATHSKAHLDMVLLDASFSCDGTTILENGTFKLPELELPVFG
jgi:2,5-dihydroxypyridine 5,6-dioxygenase